MNFHDDFLENLALAIEAVESGAVPCVLVRFSSLQKNFIGEVKCVIASDAAMKELTKVLDRKFGPSKKSPQ
jgi:hypothetical protein